MNASIEISGIPSLAGTLERQLRLLRELSADLFECRKAYVDMDLDAIYRHIAAQSLLCDQLHQSEIERKAAWRAICKSLDLDPEAVNARVVLENLEPQAAAQIREILTALALAEGDLRNLNRAQTVLVEGSRRTLSVLANVLGSFAPIYGRPVADRSSSAAAGNGGNS